MIRWTIAGLLLFFCTLNVNAQVSRGGSDGSAQLQAMLQQERAKTAEVTAAKQRLEADQKKAEARIAALESKLKAAQRGQSELTSRVQRYAQNAESQSEALSASRTRFDELLNKSREIASALRDSEERVAELTAQLDTSSNEQSVCAAKNAELKSINDEMVAHMRGENGGIAGFLRREPFTGIKRVREQNLADDFAYRAEDNTLQVDGGER